MAYLITALPHRGCFGLHPRVPMCHAAPHSDSRPHDQARVIDIRASPYDSMPYHAPDAEDETHRFDLTPICVETLEGRQQYMEEQEALWKRAMPLRLRLIEAYDLALGYLIPA